jgi:type IV pilus assembly protein PilV
MSRPTHSNHPARLRPTQAGSTLIEALVALLVLSIGLLGIAGLVAASMRYSQGGWARAAVSSSLSDLADRIRTNPSATITAYVFNTSPYAAQRSAFDGGQVKIATDCLNTICAASDLANFQLTEWRLALNGGMPGAAAWVSGQRDQGYTATVMWFDKAFVKSDGVTLDTSATCTAAMTGVAARQCCPAEAQVIAGVRCTNMTIVP